jgi:hypothetical protein
MRGGYFQETAKVRASGGRTQRQGQRLDIVEALMCPIALTPGNNHPDESPDDERLGSWVSAANGLSAHDRGQCGWQRYLRAGQGHREPGD